MTNKQKQCLLFYLGYYTGDIDGKWGHGSKSATKALQMDFGLTVDGIFGKDTEEIAKAAVAGAVSKVANGDWWGEIKYFKRAEFACKCGGKYCNGFPVEPSKTLVRLLDDVRGHYGVAFTPNSAIRCKKYNALPRIGGASNSQHLYGTAADISVPGVTPKQLAAYLETLLPNTGGIGVYSWGCHVDTRTTKSRWNG